MFPLGLNNLQSGIHRQYMKDLFVELCLTVPVRLRYRIIASYFVEYLPTKYLLSGKTVQRYAYHTNDLHMNENHYTWFIIPGTTFFLTFNLVQNIEEKTAKRVKMCCLICMQGAICFTCKLGWQFFVEQAEPLSF